RLDRHRLPRHRPGTDRRDDRELSIGARLEHDEEESARGAGTKTGGIYGRVAGREMKFRSLFLLLLLACSSHPPDQDRLKFWGLGHEGEVVAQMLPEFTRRTGIRVEVQQIPWSAAHEKLLTAYVGDSTPDVAQMGNTWIPEFNAVCSLEQLDPFIWYSAIH